MINESFVHNICSYYDSIIRKQKIVVSISHYVTKKFHGNFCQAIKRLMQLFMAHDIHALK
jgi:hypothetical protein